MNLRRLPVAVAIAALFAGAVTVRGYIVLSPEQWWQDGTIQVHVQITGGTAGPLLDGSASLNVAFENALQTWNQYLGRIQFVPVRDSTVTIGDGDDVSNVFLSGDVYGKPFGSDVFVLTNRWYDTVTKRRTEFDTIFNSAYNWNAYRGPQRPGVVDLTRVALRQLGLAIGLNAPDANGQPGIEALMNLGISDRDALTLDDISGAQSLYGAAVASPPPSSASQVKQFKTQTDATGVATFVPTGGRAVSVRFVDEDTRAGIPGADAYLFADPNGVATVALYDPFGRYFTRMAPMRLPQSVAAADPPRGVRPIDVPVPSVIASPQGTASVLMDRLPIGMAAAMAPVMQRGRELLDAAVANKIVVDREITLAELTEPSIKSVIQDNVRDNTADNIFEYIVDKSGLAAKDRIMTWFTRLGVATTARDAVWDLSRVGFSEMGYADDQKFRVKILQAPIPLPSFIRKYTEWKIYVTPLEGPRRSDLCDYYGLLCQGGGVINGRMVDATSNEPLSGLITVTGSDDFLLHPGANGFFASAPIKAGLYQISAGANGYRSQSVIRDVKGEGKIEDVPFAMVPVGIKTIVMDPPSATIKDNQVISFKATAYGRDNRPYAPTPRIFYYSDNPGVATIDTNTGGVRGVKAGRALIFAAADQMVSVPAAVLTVERSAPCPYTVSPTGYTATAAGGTGSFTVTTDEDCAWTAVSQSSGLTVTSGSSGSGNGSVRFAVAASTSTSTRTLTLLIATRTVTITQAGTAPAPTPAPTPTPGPSGGRYDGTYDFTLVHPVQGGQRTQNLARFFIVSSGRISSTDGTVAGSVTDNNTGSVRFTAPCHDGSGGTATWVGTLIANTPKTGQGTYTCQNNIVGGTWSVSNGR